MTDEPKVYIVGAGPGDPELITVKGLRILQRAAVILYTDSLVPEELVFQGNPRAEIYKSAGMDLEAQIALMVAKVRAGLTVARVHTGDPAVFGAIMEQVARLSQAGVAVEIIPGVSSVFAAAAALKAELTIPELTQTVILTRVEGRTPMPEREKLQDLARHQATMAFFLSGGLAATLVSELTRAGWSSDTPVAVVQRASWPDEKVVRTRLADLAAVVKENRMTSQAMILAGWALDPDLAKTSGYRSKLYDKSFSHRFRRAEKGGDR